MLRSISLFGKVLGGTVFLVSHLSAQPTTRDKTTYAGHLQTPERHADLFTTILTRKWSYSGPNATPAHEISWDDAAIVDIEGTGRDDVIGLGRTEGTTSIVILSADGLFVRHFPVREAVTKVAAARLPKAGKVIILGWSSWGDAVYCYDSAGRLRWRYAPSNSAIDSVAAADIDGDGDPEIIVGYNGSDGLHVLTSSGKLRWKNTTLGNCWDVGFVRTGTKGGLVLTTEAGGKIHGFDTNGKEHFIASEPNTYLEAVGTAKLGPGTSESVIGLSAGFSGEAICLFDSQGRLVWRRVHPWSNGYRGELGAVSILADRESIIVMTDSHSRIEAYDGAGNVVFPKKAGLDILCVRQLRDLTKQYLVTVSGSAITCYSVSPPSHSSLASPRQGE